MTVNFKLSRAERIRILFYSYYFGRGMLAAIFRIVAGPALLFLAYQNLYLRSSGWTGLGYAFLIVGIAYLLYPFLRLLFLRSATEPISFTTTVEHHKLGMRTDDSYFEVPLNKLSSKRKIGKYYAVRINRASVFFPIYQLSKNEQQQFIQKLHELDPEAHLIANDN